MVFGRIHSSLTLLVLAGILFAMQTLDYRIFCQGCKQPTYHEVRYRSDNQFIGRVLVCENCGERIFEPIAIGRMCEDC